MVSQSHSPPLKILFFPFMAQGHMLPMLDMAKLFASHGVESILFTTPANAPLIDDVVHLHIVPFPTVPGLPSGIENAYAITSPEMRLPFFQAVSMLQEPFDKALTQLSPDAVVSDMFLPWTADVAAQHDIPRLIFHGTNIFSRCTHHSYETYKPLETLPADADSFVLPGLPHEIKLLRTQADRSSSTSPMMADLLKRVADSEAKSYGVVVNSFYELEPDYVRHYRDVIGRKAWHIGPVSLCNQRASDNAAINREACIDWLDNRKAGSVLYVCFGSMTDFREDHMREIAMGLEASNRPFVWVVKKPNADMIPEGFEERSSDRGLVIKGWAPQTLILSHKAIGAYVTHCGWNSSLEGICAGVPLITWPMFAEQFYNERLIVDVLKIGVAVGVKNYSGTVEDREVVSAEVITDAVCRVMGEGEEAEERRQRAKELAEKARKAVKKGGSSYVDIDNLIQELADRRQSASIGHGL